MKEYLIDEFVGVNDQEDTIEEQIDKKISLLYDMCILCKRGTRCDKKEALVRQWLAAYTTELQINNAMRDVVTGKLTLDDKLKQRGYLQ